MQDAENTSTARPTCACLSAPSNALELLKDLGMDDAYGEVALLACPDCGQVWLRYFYEVEAFSRSGRWYLGALTAGQAGGLSARDARDLLGRLAWYFYGGSYYGRSGRSAGAIL